jgi:hypothetical protein
MKEKALSEMTDEELIAESKKIKSTHLINALIIGFLIGIVVYSVWKNSLGFFTLIPLFFTYKLVNKSNGRKKELERLLKDRNLK